MKTDSLGIQFEMLQAQTNDVWMRWVELSLSLGLQACALWLVLWCDGLVSSLAMLV